MEKEPRRIRAIVNLSHVLGFPPREGGGRVGIKEEEDADDSAMTNVELKSGAAGNDGRRGRLVATILESRDPPPLNGGYWKAKEGLVSTEQHCRRPWLSAIA